MLKAILFDLDNTLIDYMHFKKETAKAAAKAMIAQGLPASEKEIYDKIFQVYEEKGIEYQKTMYEVVKQYGLEINRAEKIQQAGILAYLKRKFEVLKTYPDVLPTLEKLKEKGLKLALVSDAPRNKAWQRLIMAGLENAFDLIITHNDTEQFKPHPSPFQLALKTLNISPEEALFVGDNPGRDIRGAKKLGIRTCLAEYGRVFERSEEADHVIMDIKELLGIPGIPKRKDALELKNPKKMGNAARSKAKAKYQKF